MKVGIGSDHRGVEQRKINAAAVTAAGHTPVDLGTCSTESVDYPDVAAKVAREVSAGNVEVGVLLCGTGIGVSIAANKIPGIRAANCCNVEMARLSRQHNDANILCMGGDAFSVDEFHEMLRVWLQTEFEGGRHARRVGKIEALERR